MRVGIPGLGRGQRLNCRLQELKCLWIEVVVPGELGFRYQNPDEIACPKCVFPQHSLGVRVNLSFCYPR